MKVPWKPWLAYHYCLREILTQDENPVGRFHCPPHNSLAHAVKHCVFSYVSNDENVRVIKKYVSTACF